MLPKTIKVNALVKQPLQVVRNKPVFYGLLSSNLSKNKAKFNNTP